MAWQKKQEQRSNVSDLASAESSGGALNNGDEHQSNSGSDLGWTGHVRSLGYVWQIGLKQEWTHRIGVIWTLPQANLFLSTQKG